MSGAAQAGIAIGEELDIAIESPAVVEEEPRATIGSSHSKASSSFYRTPPDLMVITQEAGGPFAISALDDLQPQR